MAAAGAAHPAAPHPAPLVIAFYVTGHGLGHATRTIEVCKHLVAAGHSVTVVTTAPAAAFHGEVPPRLFALRRAALDTGARQADAFTVDARGSLEDYAALAVAQRAPLLEAEAAWLRATRADLVATDVVPLACAAAAAAGVPAVAVSNFSWDFIYSGYVAGAGAEYRRLVWQIADDYSRAARLLRLPGYVPMPAFREVVDVPLVVRRARRGRAEVRAGLEAAFGPQAGGGEDGSGWDRLAVFIYGGQPPGAAWRLRASCLPRGWRCVVCAGGAPPGGGPLPPNFALAPAEVYTPDLVAAADAVVGKIGYGTASECLAHGTPLVFLRRDHFNEEPFLRRLLQLAGAAVEMRRRDFLGGNWAPYLAAATRCAPRYGGPTNGAEVVAGHLVAAGLEARAAAAARGGAPPPPSPRDVAGDSGDGAGGAGRQRLRDSIIWGYLMQRHAAAERVEVPAWYVANGLPPPSAGGPLGGGAQSEPASPRDGAAGAAPPPGDGASPPAPPPPLPEALEVVGGAPGAAGFPGTAAFLATLAALDDAPPAPGGGAPPELPERAAARGLFGWGDADADVFVARAPGRIDVMGGIADYSGSLVLQTPTAEAAHVACQRQPPGRQRLWRAQAAAMGAAAGAPRAALRVVSFNADATNRGPAFDCDLADLGLGPGQAPGSVVSYADARAYFARDPALAWAAYVGGCLVVLAREAGAAFADGLSLLVASGVPEGAGVSSSAAVEVATMSALAAAHGVVLEPRQLALLCQKVENEVVGAPCGVMDQMAAAAGRAGALLALRCQPAEAVGAPVPLPAGLALWALDSGVRHSVSGADYGGVRAGAFIGRALASRLAAQDAAGGGAGGGGAGGGGSGAGAAPAAGGGGAGHTAPAGGGPDPLVGGGYLANVPPSEWAARFEPRLPEAVRGADFLAAFPAGHGDAATAVDPAHTYAVRAPAGHPVAENFRVAAFRLLLLGAGGAGAGGGGGAPLAEVGEALGELMAQSHASYSRVGLGCAGTDRLVALVAAERAAAATAGAPAPLYGAKVTGGGSGGAVAVLGAAGGAGEAALRRVAAAYAAETGHAPHVFAGSSPGAAAFGHLRVRRRGAGA